MLRLYLTGIVAPAARIFSIFQARTLKKILNNGFSRVTVKFLQKN
jgi:hypothetical protein